MEVSSISSLSDARVVPPSRCPLCRKNASFENKETYKNPLNKIRYDLYQCDECGAQFWMPLKNPGGEWYLHDPRYAGANQDPNRNPTWGHKKTISFLHGKEGRVFDVGCGTGNFLSWAERNGWHVYGIDFNPDAVRAATTVFGLPHIELATLDEAVAKHPEYAGTFDLVTFFDVFEHIDNHNEFAQQVKVLLKPRGFAAMSLPYRRGARFLQPADVPPRHLTRWDKPSLTDFWKRHGFEMIYLHPMPVSFFTLVMKCRFKYGRIFSFGLVGNARKHEAARSAAVGKSAAQLPLRVRALHTLAKTKDIVLFGIPAFFLWLILLPTEKRATDMLAIIRKVD